MKPSQLALRDSIRVFELASQTVAIAVGTKSAGCPGPRLRKTRAGCFDLACECVIDCQAEAAERYFVVQPITSFLKDREIRIRHAGGIDSQRVQRIDPQSEMLAAPTPILGFSQDFSLEAAFKDALKKLDPAGLKEPGLVEVVSLGALYGGFSGFSRMFVRVESRHDLEESESRKNRQGLT